MLDRDEKKLRGLQQKLSPLDGPLVILGRPHSGTRPMAKAFMCNGVHMGQHIAENFLDSEEWYSYFVLPLITSRFFPDWPAVDADPEFEQLLQQQLLLTLKHFLPSGTLQASAWGWKLSESLFLMPVIKRVFPKARFVHMIRDGRDVALSDGGYFQLTSPPRSRRTAAHFVSKAKDALLHKTRRNAHRYDYRQFCLNITFGAAQDTWQGIDLNDFEQLAANRYLLQMQSWRHCIETARHFGQALQGDYLEVRYEEFCEAPQHQVQRVFDFLGQTMTAETRAFLQQDIRTGRIGKWRQMDFDSGAARDFANAERLGSDLLRQLGYDA